MLFFPCQVLWSFEFLCRSLDALVHTPTPCEFERYLLASSASHAKFDGSKPRRVVQLFPVSRPPPSSDPFVLTEQAYPGTPWLYLYGEHDGSANSCQQVVQKDQALDFTNGLLFGH